MSERITEIKGGSGWGAQQASGYARRRFSTIVEYSFRLEGIGPAGLLAPAARQGHIGAPQSARTMDRQYSVGGGLQRRRAAFNEKAQSHIFRARADDLLLRWLFSAAFFFGFCLRLREAMAQASGFAACKLSAGP